ncbi:MAG: hypothetical protein EOO70_08720, partial [Myxococcaceae bacterium]
CVGSADCCVTVYELSNQDVCGRVTALDSIPSAIECFQRPTLAMAEERGGMGGTANRNNAHIVIGDSAGWLHVLPLHEEFGNSSEVGMKKKNQLLFAESAQHMHKVRVHGDWITKLLYVSEVNALITASGDSTLRFVDVEKWQVLKTFSGHQATSLGIRTFSWSAFNRFIISGADRVLLFWDAFTLDVISRIDNLRSPVIMVEVQDRQQKVRSWG